MFNLILPHSVKEKIADRCTAVDHFDSNDFDPILYLNQRLTEDTPLSDVKEQFLKVQKELNKTENEFLSSVESQAQYTKRKTNPVAPMKQSVTQLYGQVASIREKAQMTVDTVSGISHYIQLLDSAKKNISSRIYTLRCIQLWTLQLQAAAGFFNNEKYTQCRDALKEAQGYQSQLSHLSHLQQIQEMNEAHSDLCRQLDSKTYYLIFVSQDIIPFDDVKEETLKELCAIVDLLGKECRDRLRDHIIECLLKPYKLRFKRGTEDAKLERTERRFVFLRTILDRYLSVMEEVFPPQWSVPQELCLTFSLLTGDELKYQLQQTAEKLDVALLTYVLQKTIDMEKDLTLMMEWKNDFPGRELLPKYKYNGIILSAFKNHMDVFMKNEKELIKGVLSQPIIGEGQSALTGWNGETEAEMGLGTSLPLADDLFVFIKESLKRSTRVSQQDVTMGMASIWCEAFLQLSAQAKKFLPTAATSLRDLRRSCIIANTALLCRSTAKDLSEAVQMGSGLSVKDFQGVNDSFTSLYASSIQCIVSGLTQTLTQYFQQYTRCGTADQKKKAGQSLSPATTATLIRSIVSKLHDCFLTCSGILMPDALRFLLDKMAAAVIPAFVSSIYECSHIDATRAKMFHEDSLILKKAFLELPNYNDPQRFTASSLSIYLKLVGQQLESLLCTFEVWEGCTLSNMDALTDFYYAKVPPNDRSIAHFVAVVERMGMHRDDAQEWIKKLSKMGVVKETPRDAALGLNKK